MICLKCKSENIIERDITPFFACYDCGYSFNEEEFPFIIDHYDKNKSLNEIIAIIYDKNDKISSILLIYLILFPFIIGFFI
jgi:hypothetical protein